MVFGYRTAITRRSPRPCRPNNSFSPGADQGQPTPLLSQPAAVHVQDQGPGRCRDQELVWTLTRDGKTETAYGTLLMVKSSRTSYQREVGRLGNESVQRSESTRRSRLIVRRAHGLGRETGRSQALGRCDGIRGAAAACSRGANVQGRGRVPNN